MKKLIYTAICFLLILSACETIELRDQLGSPISADQIDLEVKGVNTPGSNHVVVINHTPQYGGVWTLVDETSPREVDTVLIPFLGPITFTFNATTDGGIIKIEKEYVVTTMDTPLDPAWTMLAGSTPAGKTWVWAFDSPSLKGQGPWGNGAYLQDNAPSWWGPSADGSGYDGTNLDEMTFDLNGAANYTIVSNNSTSNGQPKGTFKGNFKFDIRNSTSIYTADSVKWAIGTLKISGGDKPTISRGFSPNEANKKIMAFNIIKLTENELILTYVPKATTSAGGEAWFWVFKPKGHVW